MNVMHVREVERLQAVIDRLERENQHKSEIITTLVDKVEYQKRRLGKLEADLSTERANHTATLDMAISLANER